MDSFIVYDLIFLVLFSIFVILFLYKRRNRLDREGIMYLYRTKVGIKAINSISDRFSRFLHGLKYVIVTVGFILMSVMVYLMVNVVYTYIKFPQITKMIKAPPIAPVIPYFPKLFGMESFFPPFYFTYFILSLAIVAIVHEFSHGIYMRLFKMKIKSTGFVFLGPILGAFVEEDRKQLEKKKNFEQMSVLAAGTFANTFFAALFFGMMILFFSLSFSPAGYQYAGYAQTIIPVGAISGMIELPNNFTQISLGNQTFLMDDKLKIQLNPNNTAEYYIVYNDAPAIRAGLNGIITQIDDIKITDQEALASYLNTKKPGEVVNVKTLFINSSTNEKKISDFNLTLGKNPLNNSRAYVGIGSQLSEPKGIIGKFISFLTSFKKSSTYYETNWDGELVIFIYNLLWWVCVINILVALFNMLPLGILDGGRFFYLTLLSITKSKKFSKLSFDIVTYILLESFALMMLLWFVRIF